MKNGDQNSDNHSSKKTSVLRIFPNNKTREEDIVSIEEPLEISVAHGPASHRRRDAISVTMRTPGNDFNLALGFLFTEGIVSSIDDIANIRYTSKDSDLTIENYVQVDLRPEVKFDESQLSRHFYTSSSCGVCGKSAIELVNKQSIYLLDPKDPIFPTEIFYALPKKLRKLQKEFISTGGIHAAALFDVKGSIHNLAEDVGRHNAMDKLIGYCIKKSLLPLRTSGILVSGRTSFELVQKAWMAGVCLVAGVGAPSSLAIELAEEAGISLIGFLKEDKFNVYSCFSRIN